MPKCPVCEDEAKEIDPGRFHCGRVRLLSQPEDHYLGFKTLPEKLPNKGCPICGRPMEDIGKFKWLFSEKEEGLERMYCEKADHYCYVTKIWYNRHNRSIKLFRKSLLDAFDYWFEKKRETPPSSEWSTGGGDQERH